MNEQEQAELAQLKALQARLQQELASLSNQLQAFEQRLTIAEPKRIPTTPPAPPVPVALTAPPIPTTSGPPPIPPVIPQPTATAKSLPPPMPAQRPGAGIAGPPRVEASSPATRAGSSSKLPGIVPIAPQIVSQRPPEPPTLTTTGGRPPETRSFEMRLGTYWLVRVGIVMVLTGLVFFGNLAYQNYISRLGPGGKICLLYLASGILLGAGWWWQRQAVKESLKNYAQVLFAGGLAALYFTTYAAHYLEPLRVIESPLLDGLLLLVCAGFMVWIADRKKSEVLALFAVGLAYYTSIITRVGYFTLYSNLVLTIAAVCFLVRNRWAALSFGSLVATYAAYGFWRFFDGSAWHWASPAEGLWSGTYFLISYWVVFTCAVFLSRDQKVAGENRAAFLTLNNGAFFTMFLLTMMQVHQEGFWKFALIYGGSLLVLSELSRRVLGEEPLARDAYLTQGLLLATVGFISKFAGLQLALVLAAESVVLLIMGQQRKNMILTVGAYAAAGLSIGWGMDGMRQNESAGVWLAIGLGVLMLVNTILVHRENISEERVVVRPQPGYFAVLALLIWLVTTWDNLPQEQFALGLALESIVLTALYYAIRIREVTLFGQGYLVIAQLAWLWNWIDRGHSVPWWNPALLIGVSLGLSHWWQKQKELKVPLELAQFWQLAYALGTVGLFYFWLSPKVDGGAWLVLSAGLALGLTAYGVFTRAWFVAACGQLFVAVSAMQFARQILQDKPGWSVALAPMAALALLSGATLRWFHQRPEANARIRDPLLQLAMLYRWVALVMSIAWTCDYVPARERIWVLSLVGLSIFLFAGLKRSREALFFSAAYTVTALALFWLPLIETPRVYWPNLIAILSLLAQRQVARRCPDRFAMTPEIHTGVILLGGLSLWLFVSRWVLEQASGFYLTASWSLLALAFFTCGIVLRERVYRWLGLGVLVCALGRVIIFDVWKLETLYKVLSFMALGIVLLVLGFVYNKYQEKIREWL